MDSGLLGELLATFSEREMVVIASTIAQVNFWTRMIQGLGVPPAGFSGTCSILRLETTPRWMRLRVRDSALKRQAKLIAEFRVRQNAGKR